MQPVIATFTILVLFFVYPSSSIAEIEFFNTEVLRKRISQKITLLENSQSTLIEPRSIQLDNENGLHTAASIYYSAEEVSFNDLVSSIDNKYPDTKIESLSSKDYVSWRVEEKQFIISLSSELEHGTFSANLWKLYIL